MSFETVYFQHTKQSEGGYANSSKDKSGGETYKGVSRRWHKDWEGWPIVDKIKGGFGLTAKSTYGRSSTWKLVDSVAAKDPALEAMVEKFYRKEFYATYDRPEIPERLRDKLFDAAVNTGHSNAITFLQKSLLCLKPGAIRSDGNLGSKTLALTAECVERHGEGKILDRIVAYQLAHYQSWLKGKCKQYWPQREVFYARARWLPR